MALSLAQQHLFNYFRLVYVSSFESTLQVYEEIIDELNINKSCESEQLSKEISEINKVIQNYDLEIVFTVDEISCEKLCILVNTANNAISQSTKFYDESTSHYFSKIVRDCLLSEEGTLSEIYCLNLSTQLKITKSNAQSILQKLTRDKWLVSVNNKISLGMRTVAELEHTIKQNYPDNVKYCPFCKLLVIQGHICNICKTKSHLACIKKYLSLSLSNHVCQNCKEELDDASASRNTKDSNQSEEDSVLGKSPPKKRTRKFRATDDVM